MGRFLALVCLGARFEKANKQQRPGSAAKNLGRYQSARRDLVCGEGDIVCREGDLVCREGTRVQRRDSCVEAVRLIVLKPSFFL
jgi:hypothetical protein